MELKKNHIVLGSPPSPPMLSPAPIRVSVAHTAVHSLGYLFWLPGTYTHIPDSGSRIWRWCFHYFSNYKDQRLSMQAINFIQSFPRVSAVNHGNETDRLALLAIKAKITHDPFGFLSSWNRTIHFCQWHGVTCGRRHQRVTELELSNQALTGSISPYIGNLSFLNHLILENNSFIQDIPPEVGHLQRLQYLWLNNNSFSGKIPINISGCSNLVSLDLSVNRLIGKIPIELDFLLKLQEVHVNNNNLTGIIPYFGNLSSLMVLDATSNSLAGSIPNGLGQLKNLEYILLGDNRLSGIVPLTIFNVSSLLFLDLGSNQFQGSLPLEFGTTLPNLQFFSIAFNQFTGLIPVSISNMSYLAYLFLSSNKLTGKMPNFEKLRNLRRLSAGLNGLGNGEANDLSFIPSLMNATDLELLEIQNNNFGGMLQESLSNLSSNLRILYLGGNHLSGSIPIGIEKLINLEDLQMWGNRFTGNIPPGIGKLQKLYYLSLSRNQLSGNIPLSIGNLSLLNIIGLYRNHLNGGIPISIGNCQNLQILSFSENNFSGEIPQQFFGLAFLYWVDLSHNCLNGTLLVEVGNLKNLEVMNISHNMLSGEIPDTFGSCTSMEVLHMEANFFRGTIPLSFSSLRGIRDLDLSGNNLSGSIPHYLTDFDLQYLNLSVNDFEGMLPREGIFKNASAIFVNGNNKLCGGIHELGLPMCNFGGSKKKRSTLILELTIPITIGLVGLTLVMYFFLHFQFRRTKDQPHSNSPNCSLLRVSYQSLLQATDGFSSTNMIGMGSFGSVYKGILNDGMMVAVKVLNLNRHGAFKSFTAECEALRNIRHRNLVKLLTSCSGIDYQGNDFKAVVYELMVNRSLEDWLHPILGEDEPHVKHLNFLQRLNIAIDVAHAFDYLHNHCQTPIVHCDIKPSNILLDNQMIGHVGDFGLARLLQEVTKNSVDQTRSIGVKGSVGYAPPEYGMGSKVSTAGDVYSYGILLLEMFTGKRPTHDMFCDGLNLHNFVKMVFPERIFEIVDPILLLEGKEKEASTSINLDRQCSVSCPKIQQSLISIFRIGIACSAESPGERMSINNVVVKLHVIRNVFLQTAGVHGIKATTLRIQSSS